MELRQLRYFVAIVEAGGFTRAAAAVRVAQPAISVQIRRLEAELGEPLFHRDQRAVRLTAAGEALLPHARAAVMAADRGADTVSSLRGVLHGRLRVGLSGPPEPRLARALGAFHRTHPAVELRLTTGETNEATIAAVADGALDAALVGLGAQAVPPGVQTRVVGREPLVAVVGSGHRLTGRRRVTVEDLRDEPLVTLVRGTGLRTLVDRAAGAAGFTPRLVAETTELPSLVDLAAEGLGLAVVPHSVVERDDVHVLALTRPRLERRTALAWHAATASPAARAFVAQAAGVFG